jgi:D-glycero-D-manno-heptose 1,7-bisphosphate phosphatase
MNRAVFLDRDGVINRNVFNPKTGQLESPHRVEDFELFPWTIDSIRLLKKHFHLFLVSNQPSFAKKKTSLKNIKNIHEKFISILNKNDLGFEDYFYCYHHPDGTEPKYSGPCECRKPSPFFLKIAETRFSLNMNASWMIGDRITDVQCGQAGGVRTIFICDNINSKNKLTSHSDFTVKNLDEASKIIINNL